MAYGLTSEGFIAKPFEAVQADLEDEVRAALGQDVNLAARSNLGQLIGIVAEAMADLWQALEAVHDSQYPEGASGADLDALAGLSGTLRLLATYSVARVVLVGTNGTVVPAGSVATVTGSGVRFALPANATIGTRPPWIGAADYAPDDLVVNGGHLYVALTAGTAALSGGPTGTGTAIVDGSVTWRHVASGSAGVVANMTAERTGSLAAPTGTLTGIATPVGGWSSVVNHEDATLGSDVESDASLRVRREVELRAQGLGAVGAIQGRLSRLTGVSSVAVYENTSDVTDGNGMPPHSVEAVVVGGADDDVAAAVLEAKPAGIATSGNTTGSAEDTQGTPRVVKWSRLVDVETWVTVELRRRASGWPEDGDALVAAALVAYGEQLGGGVPLVVSRLYPVIESVPGIYDVTAIKVGTAPNPTASVNLEVGIRERVDLDSARIVVVVSA